MVEARLKIIKHFADVRVASAVLDDAHTIVVGTPLDDFDADVANTPLVHSGARGLVEVDGIGTHKCTAVVIDLIEDARLFGDSEKSAFRVA